MFESRISAGRLEKLPFSKNTRISSWSYDMAGHERSVWNDIVWWQTRRLSNSTKYLFRASMTTTSKKKSVGELSTTCSQIVLKCLYLVRIGQLDILWSVNKLARSITKWTKACEKRLTRLISYLHHTCEYKQYCHVGNTAKQCRLGLFQDADFEEDLKESKPTSGGTLCILGSHASAPLNWMCEKQIASHSSTKSTFISFDVGLRLGCLLRSYGISYFRSNGETCDW